MTLLPIVLPAGYISKVSVNDKVNKGSLLAEKPGSLGEEIVDLVNDYKIPISDLNKSLKKNLGDFIKSGEELAVKSGSFGMGAKKILSKTSGTVAKIDQETGKVYIKTALEEKGEQIFSPVEGKVEICNNDKIVIRTEIEAIMAEDCLGDEAQGKIFYLKNISEHSLSSEANGKILLTKIIDKASVFKAIGLDILGIITEELEDIDFVDLSEKRISVPIMIVSKDNFEKIAKHENANLYLNGKDKTLIFYE